jgi:hypothetical protein
MRIATLLLTIGIGTAATGCAEYATLITQPSGAQVYINGTPAGQTPLEYRMARKDVGLPLFFRVEKVGYEPVEGKFICRRSRGRVTGMVFTAGLLAIFRTATVYEDVHMDLRPAHLRPVSDKGTLEERLTELQRLHDRGLLSDREFMRYRSEILDSLLPSPPDLEPPQ